MYISLDEKDYLQRKNIMFWKHTAKSSTIKKEISIKKSCSKKLHLNRKPRPLSAFSLSLPAKFPIWSWSDSLIRGQATLKLSIAREAERAQCSYKIKVIEPLIAARINMLMTSVQCCLCWRHSNHCPTLLDTTMDDTLSIFHFYFKWNILLQISLTGLYEVPNCQC